MANCDKYIEENKEQGLANFSYKRQVVNNLDFAGRKISALVAQNGYTQNIQELVWLCSNKASFTKAGGAGLSPQSSLLTPNRELGGRSGHYT